VGEEESSVNRLQGLQDLHLAVVRNLLDVLRDRPLRPRSNCLMDKRGKELPLYRDGRAATLVVA